MTKSNKSVNIYLSVLLFHRFAKMEKVMTTATEKSIEDRVIEVVAEQLGISTRVIQKEFLLEMDLGADSLDRLELTTELEEEFDIAGFDNSDNPIFDKDVTVEAIIDTVKAAIQK